MMKINISATKAASESDRTTEAILILRWLADSLEAGNLPKKLRYINGVLAVKIEYGEGEE